MVSVRAMCFMSVLGSNVSKCVHASGIGACYVSFSNFLLFKIMRVRYLVAISLWILELGICRSWRSLTIVVCVVPRPLFLP